MTYTTYVQRAHEAGLSLVPGDMNKRPKVKWAKWQTEPQTREEFEALGHGSIWAVVTGAQAGFVVLDFDFNAGGDETLRRLGMNGWVTVVTPGGMHVYVQHPGHPVKNAARKWAEYPGLDVRGDGGLAWFYGRSKKGVYTPRIWPPEPATDLDPELAAIFMPEPGPETSRAPNAHWHGEDYGTPEALRFLTKVCQDIDRAPAGTSNAALNKAAFSVGGLVASGQLDLVYAEAQLDGAGRLRDAGDVATVVQAALASGMEKPWKMDPPDDVWVPSIAARMLRRSSVPESVEFPVEALPTPLDEFVRQGAESVSCPPDYIGAALLPVLGLAVGGYVDLRITETWSESAVIYATLVGPPGARKTPAINLVMGPVWEAEANLEHAARGGLEPESPEWFEVDPPQLVQDDATIEALFGVLEKNERGVILQPDELTGWVGGMGQYKGGLGRDRQHWLSIWSRRPIKVSRVKAKSRTIRRPFVTVLGGIQPEPLEDLLHGRDDGLLPRLLMAQGKFVTPELGRGRMDETLLTAYSALWNRIRDEGCMEQTMEFTDQGYRRFESWANEHYKTLNQVPPELAGAWAKLDGQCARIALILARVQRHQYVEEYDVECAVALVRYFQGQAAGLLQGTSSATPWEKQHAARILTIERLVSDNPGISKGELMALGPDWAKDSRTLDRLLEPLAEIGVWNG